MSRRCEPTNRPKDRTMDQIAEPLPPLHADLLAVTSKCLSSSSKTGDRVIAIRTRPQDQKGLGRRCRARRRTGAWVAGACLRRAPVAKKRCRRLRHNGSCGTVKSNNTPDALAGSDHRASQNDPRKPIASKCCAEGRSGPALERDQPATCGDGRAPRRTQPVAALKV